MPRARKALPQTNSSQSQNSAAARGRLTLWPLIVATFFMVSGGAYDTEDVVRGAGYGGVILILLITPVLWSLPTAFMIGELASALPEEGGYYEWVRRALGNCWGFQEAWLSLLASVFDMAIYPTLFVLYLARLFPWFAVGHRGTLVGLAVVAACAGLNIAGIKVVSTTSMWLFFLLSAPFAVILVLSPLRHGALANAATPTASHVDLVGGLLVAMWNYMGWDNASTIAGEVQNPQRSYPRAMLATVALVALSYILPVAAVSLQEALRLEMPPVLRLYDLAADCILNPRGKIRKLGGRKADGTRRSVLRVVLTRIFTINARDLTTQKRELVRQIRHIAE